MSTQDNNEAFISVKRQINVRTVVNEDFRKRANTELGREIEMIDGQLQQLETAFNNSLQQLEQLANQGQNVMQARQQLEQDAEQKRRELSGLKGEVTKQLSNLGNVNDGDTVVTGVLESFADLKVGDNIYDRVKSATIVVKDGVITELHNA